jgi:hypothetical protein
MAYTTIQTLVARCRNDFSTTSATAVLITGTQRLISVTAGSYVDIEGVVACSIGAAADTFLNIYVDGTATNEGGAQSTATASDWLQLVAKTRIGPITAAQAARGILVDLRIATSASTLTINATTTPTKYCAVMTAVECTDTLVATLPSRVPHLLLWLKADAGLTYDKTTNAVTAWANQAPSCTLAYSGQTGNFTVGLLVTGGTSAATGYIHQDADGGGTGTLLLTDVRGTFVAGEIVTDSSTGSATVASAPAALVLTPSTTSPPSYVASAVNSLPGVGFDFKRADNIAITSLPTQQTSFLILAVVSTDAFLNAGSSFLNPPIAQAADCLRATLSNATVNRSALFDTNKPEYVGTGTTVTSGKQIVRLRYNVGTTTGAGAVNGGAETADATFDPPSFTWAFIGSSTGSTFATGGFRLCELLIYSWKQATTEDAVSTSDHLALVDYLNGRFLVY